MKYLMRKSDYVVCGTNKYTVKENTHIPITHAQMVWVQKNPAVNGPKMALFYMTTTGMAEEIKDAAFMDMLRKEQANQDKGAPAYVPPAAPTAPVAPVVDETAPAGTGDATKAKMLDTLRAALEALPDAEAVKKYAESVIGKPLAVHGKAGKDKCVAATIDAFQAMTPV